MLEWTSRHVLFVAVVASLSRSIVEFDNVSIPIAQKTEIHETIKVDKVDEKHLGSYHRRKAPGQRG